MDLGTETLHDILYTYLWDCHIKIVKTIIEAITFRLQFPMHTKMCVGQIKIDQNGHQIILHLIVCYNINHNRFLYSLYI